MNAPDLLNGYIINGAPESNNWLTSIQSVLNIYNNKDLADSSYYLSHECRSEKIHYLKESEPGGIFVDLVGKTLSSTREWLSYTHAGRFYVLPRICGGGVPDSDIQQAIKTYADVGINGSIIVPAHTKDNWLSKVNCIDAKIKELSFDHVLSLCHSGEINFNNLFTKTTFAYQQNPALQYTIFTRVQYLNFSSKLSDNPYLQPIHGYVLMPILDKLIDGYLAMAVNSENKQHVECIVRSEVLNEEQNSIVFEDYRIASIINATFSFYSYEA